MNYFLFEGKTIFCSLSIFDPLNLQILKSAMSLLTLVGTYILEVIYLFDYQSEICSQRVVYNYYQHILTPWIMAISKRCKPDNFDSLNSLKLSFKFCWKWIFMKVISYSIESMMKFFLIYIHFKQDLEKEKPAFSILHMLE